MRLFLTILVISIVLGSCNSGGTNENISNSENQHSRFDNLKQLKDTFSIYLDTLRQIELKGFKSDTFNFSQFYDTKNSYNLIYHEKGKIKTGDKQYGLSIYSVNDTIIRVKLLKVQQTKWNVCDSLDLYNVCFSPAMFHPTYSDFNQNGINDILLVFSQSMSVAYNHGYLILFSEETEKLTLIENSFDIPNLEVVNGKIISVTHNHPGHELRKYLKTDGYEILENKLVLIKSDKKYKK